ncbi:MAG: hypothetical protein AABY10_04045 [Nanoarchaeota archaeon]
MSLADYIKDIFSLSLGKVSRDIQESITKTVTSQIHIIQKNVIKQFIGLAVIILALIFLAISVVFLFIEYLNLSKTISFLIVGIILLFAGLIVRLLK